MTAKEGGLNLILGNDFFFMDLSSKEIEINF